MRYNCPHCLHLIVQDRNIEGLNYCTNCQRLFFVPPERKVPGWIWGVLVALTAHWQILCRL